MKSRPSILSIAGFDPSGGAGLVADIKTFEMLKCYGVSICSAITLQNDLTIKSCIWTQVEIMKSQINLLFERIKIDYAKVGVVENWIVLKQLTAFLIQKNPKIKIVLDPILCSTSGFEFHDSGSDSFYETLDNIFLITPNQHEINSLNADKSIKRKIENICKKTNLLLKGGHKTDRLGRDELYTTEGKKFFLKPRSKNISEKHGSGCILSSAITSHLALGFPLLKACYRAKRYTEKVLSSNKTLLGYHR